MTSMCVKNSYQAIQSQSKRYLRTANNKGKQYWLGLAELFDFLHTGHRESEKYHKRVADFSYKHTKQQTTTTGKS